MGPRRHLSAYQLLDTGAFRCTMGDSGEIEGAASREYYPISAYTRFNICLGR